MFKNVFSFFLCLCLATACFFSSCSDEDAVAESAELLAEQTIAEIQEETATGKQGCFELIFPVSLDFDGTVYEFMSFEELKEAIKEWAMNEPSFENRPMLVFPIEILTEESELITVESEEELIELIAECPKGAGHTYGGDGQCDGHHGKGDFCFDLVFPVSIEMPNGEILTAETRQDLKEIKREWKEENEDTEERPTLVFPVTVVLEDETELVLNNQDELYELKESCREDDEDDTEEDGDEG